MGKKDKDKFLKVEEASQARLDIMDEQNQQAASDMLVDLYFDDDKRDFELFEMFGIDPSITMSDYSAFQVVERGPNWANGLSSMIAAARAQTWIKLYGADALSEFARMAIRIEEARKKMNLTELQEVAVQGISKKDISKAKAALKEAGEEFPFAGLSPTSSLGTKTLPSLDSIKKMSNAQLLENLINMEITGPIGNMQISATQYVQKMTELRPGTPQFAAEVQNIIGLESRRGMIGLTRRAQQQWTSLSYIEGNVNMEMIWVVEGDHSTCVNCEANAGQVKTYKQWQEDGPPGAAVCLGGNYCRCDLVPYN